MVGLFVPGGGVILGGKATEGGGAGLVGAVVGGGKALANTVLPIGLVAVAVAVAVLSSSVASKSSNSGDISAVSSQCF